MLTTLLTRVITMYYSQNYAIVHLYDKYWVANSDTASLI